jgi:hypothetical protein
MLLNMSSPAAGFRSATIHGMKRCKNESTINWSLEQAVGCAVGQQGGRLPLHSRPELVEGLMASLPQ